eukprot:gene39533-biopygen17452
MDACGVGAVAPRAPPCSAWRARLTAIQPYTASSSPEMMRACESDVKCSSERRSRCRTSCSALSCPKGIYARSCPKGIYARSSWRHTQPTPD